MEPLDQERVSITLYDCQVRPGGNLLHSFAKQNVSDRELKVLRTIHGNDCVVGLQKTGTTEVDLTEHLMELAVRFGVPRVEKIFSVSLENFDDWLEMKQDATFAEREAVNEQRRASLIESQSAPPDPSPEQSVMAVARKAVGRPADAMA